MQHKVTILKSWRSWLSVMALACLLLTGGIVARAQTGETSLHTASRDELDVVKVVLGQEKAWNAGDVDGYLKGYKDSPETLFIGRQVSRGYKEIVEDYKHNYPTHSSMGSLTFSELEVHTLSDTYAVCIGKYRLDRSKREGGSADGLFSLVFEKTSDGWKIVLDHTT